MNVNSPVVPFVQAQAAVKIETFSSRPVEKSLKVSRACS